jgi:hypothetical protein
VELDSGESAQLAWTGQKVLLVTDYGGVWMIDPAGEAWVEHRVEFALPVVWADGLLFGTRYDNLAQDPFEHDPWHYPVSWDPVTAAEVEIPLPPRSAGDAVWTGRYLAFFEDGLAFNVPERRWIELEVDVIENVPSGRREGAISAWADDRLLVWGGWSGCFEIDIAYDTGYELVLEGDAASGRGLASGLLASADVGEWLAQHRAHVAHHALDRAGIDAALNVPAC